MIGKIPRPGRGFRGSFQYVMHGKRDAARDPERLAWMETRNLFVDNPMLTGSLQAYERSKDKEQDTAGPPDPQQHTAEKEMEHAR